MISGSARRRLCPFGVEVERRSCRAVRVVRYLFEGAVQISIASYFRIPFPAAVHGTDVLSEKGLALHRHSADAALVRAPNNRMTAIVVLAPHVLSRRSLSVPAAVFQQFSRDDPLSPLLLLLFFAFQTECTFFARLHYEFPQIPRRCSRPHDLHLLDGLLLGFGFQAEFTDHV